MTEQEILDGNKLIAEFMEFKKFSKSHYECNIANGSYLLPPFAMQFHTSWDWLMPVVEKVDQTGASVIIGRMFCEIKYIDPLDENKTFDIRIASGVKINAVNGALIEFIKWYNEK